MRRGALRLVVSKLRRLTKISFRALKPLFFISLTLPKLHRPTTLRTFSNLPEMTSLEMITTRELGQLELSEPGAQNTWTSTRTIMVDTSTTLVSLVDTLKTLEKSSGSIYMDLEGVKLSRLGSISIIQILVPSCEQVFIVDIHTLGKTAFDSLDSEGKSLKNALESDSIKKYLFDVRNDSDALYALFGVRLANVIDIQLLELASRRGPKHIVCGLAKCIEQEQALPSLALSEWRSTKKEGTRMFDPKLGGTYEVFNARPLPRVLIEYCIGDVQFLPLLSAIYESRLDSSWLDKALVETEKRLRESRSPSYQPHGRQKSFGPREWRYPPKEGEESTPTATASAPKKGKKSVAPVETPVLMIGEQ
jgi:exonuclease 3'-5' domain-containing protein 1